MKVTLLITQECNLACRYCYITKRRSRMPLCVAERVLDFTFRLAPADERIDIGFFGGEPLLDLPTIEKINDAIERRPDFSPQRVWRTIVTNSTLYSSKTATYLRAHDIALGISCDGPPAVHDLHRCFPDGSGTGRRVEQIILQAVSELPLVMVNAVYRPDTLRALPESVEYLSSLGVRHIYLNPDFSAAWGAGDLAALGTAYRGVAESYVRWYREGDPHFISLIDSKIAVILRNGYLPLERCRMGRGEYAFTPAGDIYPCERLVGDGGETHRIGNVFTGLELERLACHTAPRSELNTECTSCSLRDYCMHWCGCSNFFATGSYNRVSEFLCSSEKGALAAALYAYESLEADGISFYDHLGGRPVANVLSRSVEMPREQ